MLSGTLLAAAITRRDRDFAMSHLHATRKQILDLVSNLSPAQLNYKPAPDRWSIAQCLAHITAGEKLMMDLVTGEMLKTPAEAPSNLEIPDQRYLQILAGVTNRSQKAQSPNEIVPPDNPGVLPELIEAFKARRDQTIAFVENNSDDLHAHFREHPRFGRLDAYEWIVFASGHSERHYLQMKEVMAAPGFPKP
jgi:hypothetical protein